jgi:hypothetical protein
MAIEMTVRRLTTDGSGVWRCRLMRRCRKAIDQRQPYATITDMGEALSHARSLDATSGFAGGARW